MKVAAFNGSPRSSGNTHYALSTVCRALRAEGIETEIVQVGGQLLHGCIDCGYCARVQDGTCAFKDDLMNQFIETAVHADGILIGSPVYFSNITPETKALIDRLGRVALRNGGLLKRKPGAAVVAVRRAGSNVAFSAINYLFGISEMITVGSSYWNMTLARNLGDWEKDEEGIRTFETLGANMAWLLKKIYA